MESNLPRLHISKPPQSKSDQPGDPVLVKFHELLTPQDLEFLAACNISLREEGNGLTQPQAA